MKTRRWISVIRRPGRTLSLAAAVTVAGTAAALLWSLATFAPREVADSAAGWGREALSAEQQAGWSSLSPIAPANACGLGASSCFKCHNGVRAAAPRADKWHTDHKSVNYSCVGCHNGNARLIKKELAHADLIKDPRQKTAATCATCHKAGNTAELFKAYHK